MKYGYFDDKNREYVITTPNTPLPWINYLGVDDFHSLISNTLGGYSFYKDAKLRRITRYRYNNVPRDISGRFFYIKDQDVIWNIGYLPLKTPLDKYECRHGFSYSSYIGAKNGIECELTCFVPLHDAVEVNLLKITNTSKETKKFSLYSMVEFCLYNAVDDANNYQRNLNIAEVEVDDKTVYHKTEYRERRNHYTYYHCSIKHDGFDTNRDSFLGIGNGYDEPKAVIEGKSYSSMCHEYYPIGCHRLDIELKPGEEKTISFQLGYVENKVKWEKKNVINKEKAYELFDKYDDIENCKTALSEIKEYWNNLLSTYVLKTDDKRFDRMAIWNQYQCMITYLMSRSTSYYETGTGRGMGFRDSCQDLLGFVHLIPSKARERIIDIASIQFEDGSTYHQYQPLTKKGNADIGGGFNDDPLWLIAATSAYIRETGDYHILDAMVPFDNKPGSEKTLYDHLMISFRHTVENLGPHNLPLIGRADWNDCLNLNCFSSVDGESFQTVENQDNHKAESVFIAGMAVLYGHELAEIALNIKKDKDALYINDKVKCVEDAVLKSGYDKEGYYLRAYDAYEHPVGSSECEEGKIYIEPQGFCSMAQIGKDRDYPHKALESVKKYLIGKYGAELLYPPYTVYHIELGEISSYPPGYKENGSVFCHNNPWVVLAMCKENMIDDAYSLYEKTAPAFIEDISEIHKTEPYVYSQTICGRSAGENYGEAKNSWLTGTASWSFVALSQGLFGIRPEFDGLLIDPKLPSKLENVRIHRIYRGKVFEITVRHGEKSFLVNGVKQDNNIVSLKDGVDTYKVEVTL